MFATENGEKILQTLPGQGWRVLIEWKPEPADAADGWPTATLEPVIAWVTVKVPRVTASGSNYEDVIIAPMVRGVCGEDLMLLDTGQPITLFNGLVYLAPGEELAEEHFKQLLHGEYAEGVTLG